MANEDSSQDFPALIRVFEGVIEVGDEYFGDVNGLEGFLAGTNRGVVESFCTSLTTVEVGGISRDPQSGGSSSSAAGSSGRSDWPMAAGAAAGAFGLAIGGGVWYARRRSMR